MIEPFVYQGSPARVIFGSGTKSHVAKEAERLGMERALVLSTPQQVEMAEEIAGLLGDASAGVYTRAAMHTPVEVTADAMALVKDKAVDGVVSIGGGSTTGLGKAIAYRTDLPQLVIPTTYAGSEMTNILGQTEDGIKTTVRSPSILPETVIYDVDYTMGLPDWLSGISGINAIAHAVEALYAHDGNPVLSTMACEGIAALHRSLPRIADDMTNREARTDALYGAWLCGMCLGSSSIALHHKLCHVLGGSFDLPHAETHTAVLPHALAYNAPAVPTAMASLGLAMHTTTPAAALFDLAERMGAKTALKDLGMPADGIDRAVEITLKNPYWNPRELEAEGIRGIIQSAWSGTRPRV
ncbi:MAG: maleylacetate reductase [Halieaceae bacterium]|nr:maleylacetate reductase [Halieaceae bacterium]